MDSNTEMLKVHLLPTAIMDRVCNFFDESDLYKQLAVEMQYRPDDINTMVNAANRNKKSPTSVIIRSWGKFYGHTVQDFFIVCRNLKLHEAMDMIKDHVDEKYHAFIKVNEKSKIAKGSTDLAEKKILNVANVADDTRDDNITVLTQKVDNLLNVKLSSPIISSPDQGLFHIAYENLRSATHNWKPELILGKGGFGTVFRGVLQCTQVAIKRLEPKEDNPGSNTVQIKQSLTELGCLRIYRHDNILNIYGYSDDGPQPCLVYQYMPGGSLDHRLRIKQADKVLDWTSRLNIAIGSARGLQYLHNIGEKPLIHGDIKSANILLDAINNPRIGDFGLAREGPLETYTRISRVHGTRPYLPDEFLRAKKFSTKVDVYSFGIVLFEIGTALQAYSVRRSEKFLRDHVLAHEGDIADLKDPRGAAGGDVEFCGLMEIGKVCVSTRPKQRPEMVEVLKRLENVRGTQFTGIDVSY